MPVGASEISKSDLQRGRSSCGVRYDSGEQVVKRLDKLGLLLFVAGLQHAYNNETPEASTEEMKFIIEAYKCGVDRRAR